LDQNVSKADQILAPGIEWLIGFRSPSIEIPAVITGRFRGQLGSNRGHVFIVRNDKGRSRDQNILEPKVHIYLPVLSMKIRQKLDAGNPNLTPHVAMRPIYMAIVALHGKPDLGRSDSK
jgi:hypothetical protein